MTKSLNMINETRFAPLPVIVVPGLSDSGPGHWQSLWEEENPHFHRIELQDWYQVDPEQWLAAIDRAVARCDRAPIAIAHSLGCAALAKWVDLKRGTVAGAMLVAPPDVERTDHSYDISRFAPVPRTKFPFPSTVVASNDDPWCSIARAQWMATCWGSTFVSAGPCGHINVAAGFGPWPSGKTILGQLISAVRGPCPDSGLSR